MKTFHASRGGSGGNSSAKYSAEYISIGISDLHAWVSYDPAGDKRLWMCRAGNAGCCTSMRALQTDYSDIPTASVIRYMIARYEKQPPVRVSDDGKRPDYSASSLVSRCSFSEDCSQQMGGL